MVLVELAGGHGKSPISHKVRNCAGACSACPDCERADPSLSAIRLEKILGLGIVQSSRSSPRRADARDERPARRIAGGVGLFQAFVALFFLPLTTQPAPPPPCPSPT